MSDWYTGDWIWKQRLHQEPSGEYAGGASMCFIEGNRKSGKTCGIGAHVIRDFFENGNRAVVMNRYKWEQQEPISAPRALWSKAWRVLTPEEQEQHSLTFKGQKAYIDGELFSYSAPLYKYGQQKQADFDNVHSGIFDEYVPEDGQYLSDELTPVFSLYDDVARGRPDAMKTTTFFFISNRVTDNTPWHNALGLGKVITKDTKRVIRPGYALEIVNNRGIANEYKMTSFADFLMQSDAGRRYLGYAQDNIPQDNLAYVDRQQARGADVPLAMILCKDPFSIWKNSRTGNFILCEKKVPSGIPVFSVSSEYHIGDDVLLWTSENGRSLLDSVRLSYGSGRVIFDSLIVKRSYLENVRGVC